MLDDMVFIALTKAMINMKIRVKFVEFSAGLVGFFSLEY